MQREFNRIISITIGYYNEHDLENQINLPEGWAYKNPIFASQPRLSQADQTRDAFSRGTRYQDSDTPAMQLA